MMSKTTGSLVMSGAINGDTALTIRADKLSVDSVMPKLWKSCALPSSIAPTSDG